MSRSPARDHRHERELGRLRKGEAGAEQGGEREDRGYRVEREYERGGHDHLCERCHEEDAARLEPVDHEAGNRSEHDDRRPEREEQARDREARVAHLLEVQRERDPEEEVAERRDADGADDQADVSLCAEGLRSTRQFTPTHAAAIAGSRALPLHAGRP